MNYNFLPSPTRANTLDLTMRAGLADSLKYIQAKLNTEVPEGISSLDCLIDQLAQGQKYSALTFALYTHLVFALSGNSDENYTDIIELLSQQKPINAQTPEVVTLDNDTFNKQGFRLAGIMNLEEETEFLIQSPSEQVITEFEKNLKIAFDVMDKTIPDLSSEIRNLISQIILVEPISGSKFEFAGGSSYMMWGGLFLHANYAKTVSELIEVLAHESAHMLLFGYASKGRLTLNDEHSRYSSALRTDPRPMEGIFHATFVTARMFWSMQMIAECEYLDAENRNYAKEALERNINDFVSGYQMIEKEGELSEIGTVVMKNCFEFMEPHIHIKY
ncbi:HEXXH motif-containing putative peptide modification protein [Neptuniibacter sp.]|uniref:aKG-HExxH-type peptide beta-hydroxylase n=1 Tax=Neptuniibacter sp. TaxID=1962643 RepID=UPI00262E54F3|nr:HEXXH motif-containing putative peptide modification protein [Neptuniibacter sp.]MCP4598275.1 hypothetical protein [Neptuniibacter sp.]